jgi:hypothetical protein
MSKLPRFDLPTFIDVLPTTGQQITYRPFTVKEEKIFLVAQESNDIEQIVQSIKQILGNCVTGVDPETISSVDMEYLFLKLRSKSVNNVLELKMTDPDTKEEIPIKVNVDDIEVKQFPDHTNKIRNDENSLIEMRYPNINEILKVKNAKDDEPVEVVLFSMLLGCIERVHHLDEVYEMKDFSEEEISEMVETLSPEALQGIKKFFETLPVIRHEIKYTNSNGEEKTIALEGLRSFFI